MRELSESSRRLGTNGTLQAAQRVFAVALGMLFVSWGISGCFGTFSGCFSLAANGAQQAQTLAKAMHEKMARGDLAGIYNDADQRYKDAVSRAKSDALFSAVARKLGAPQDCKQQGFNFQATTSGTTIQLVCETTFSKDATGTETFVWIKSGGQFKLLGYHISSDALIER